MPQPTESKAKKPLGVSRVPKKKGGTETTQKHRFQSFTDRIAKLNIDSVRRDQSRNAIEVTDRSHFRFSLEDWKDRNLSKTFTIFAQKADPLSENLPQILHNQDRLVSLLHEALQEADPLSLEALLDLVAKLAYDVGVRFEEHFQSSVRIVSDLAAKHSDVAVVEWSFTCLAWLFKYLARLLVPDLRPLYDLMAPLLGKEAQKDFVTRFAAESMSFLFRKAASNHHKSPEQLELIVQHAFGDIHTAAPGRRSQYQQGLSALFADSIKGIRRGVTSGAKAVVQALLKRLFAKSEDEETHWAEKTVVESVLVDVIHHTDAEGFLPILQMCLETMEDMIPQSGRAVLPLQVLYVLLGTREGSRMSEWPRVLRLITKAIDSMEGDDAVHEESKVTTYLANITLAVQYAPLEHLSSFCQTIMATFEKDPWNACFLALCNMIADVGRQRFDALFLSSLRQFVLSKWEPNEAGLLFLLPKIYCSSQWPLEKFRISQSWQDKIREAFFDSAFARENNRSETSLLHEIKESYKIGAYLDLLEVSHTNNHFLENIADKMAELIGEAAQHPLNLGSKSHLLLAKGLTFMALNAADNSLPEILRSRILSMASLLGQRPSYLRGLHKLLLHFEQEGCSLDVFGQNPLTPSLIENLASPSHQLRQLSIDIMADLYRAKELEVPKPLQVAQTLENMTFGVENQREASMDIRKLASTFTSMAPDPLCERAIPAYCFGLFHVRMTPLWTDASLALQTMMSSVPEIENAIVERAVSWLSLPLEEDGPSPTLEESNNETDIYLQHVLPGFQCVNLSRLDRSVSTSFLEVQNIERQLIDKLSREMDSLPIFSEANRSQSLLVFRQMPELAEKKSRFIVPILLDWETVHDDVWIAEDENISSVGNQTRGDESFRVEKRSKWSKKDKKAMLSLFSEFKNPSVLYRSEEVYDALLSLLRNGDIEVQRSALKALFTWRSPFTKPYEQNLLNLLDDSRFREELTAFLDDEDTTGIRMEHRAGLMPILLRLLYGRVVTRSGLGGSRGTQETRRRAVFSSILRFGPATVVAFVNIALAPFAQLTSFKDYSDLEQDGNFSLQISPRKQSGALRMLHGMLESLSAKMESITDRLVAAVMFCLVDSSRRLDQIGESSAGEQFSLWKSVRHEALTCLDALFRTLPQSSWISQIKALLFNEVVKPRLANLPIETAQAPSILLKMFSTWSSSAATAYLLWNPEPQLLGRAADCLTVPSAKDEVKIFVLRNIVGNLIARAEENSHNQASESQERFANVFLHRIIACLEQQPSKECQEECIRTIINIQPYIADVGGAKELLDVSLKMLSEPSRKVNPKLKGEILLLLGRFLPFFDVEQDPKFHSQAVSSISKLFGYFHDVPNRNRVVTVFEELTKKDPKLRKAAEVCRLLNSPSPSRLDQPDFEARAAGFNLLNEMVEQTDEPRIWEPVLNNLLFFVHDDEELSTRSSASLNIRQLIQRVTSHPKDAEAYRSLFDETIFPVLQKGMREPSELIRSEYVSILAELVKAGWHTVEDMRSLLGTDEETSFFNNVLHLQQHRRVRALRCLASGAAKVSATNLSRLCIPLIENFLAEVDESNQNLANETVQALKEVVSSLEWHRYRALLQRQMQDNATFTTKLGIRTLAAVVQGLYAAQCVRLTEEEGAENASSGRLLRTLPSREALSTSLKESVLAKLLDQIHYQDETSIDVRILLAVIAVKIILVLPESQVATKLPAVLIDVCNILKSKAQEARDSARKTLSDISAIIGPKYFGFVLKQLKTALKRGSQLHVLSYTVHSIMVAVTPKYPLGSLDYCLPEIVGILIDDTFGSVGQDKEAAGYVNSMKEFKKKSVGFDTMELLASISTLGQVSQLLKPIQLQLQKPRPNMAKIDELLRRIREGLRRNEMSNSQQSLVLCFEILKDAASKTGSVDGSQRQANKMTAFAFELLRRILDKHEDLKTPPNLMGFVDMLQLALKSEDEEVSLATMRFLGSIIKVPLKGLDEHADSYIRLARRTIESSSSINTPNGQGALRLVSALLRERPAAVIKKSRFEADVAFLLARVKPDLEEPSSSGEREYQVAAFNFLKAVMSRGIIVKEMYEVMDVVREVMITSQSSPIPDLARSVYARFVLDYFPEEGKGLSKQLQFLITNLQYEHQRGRQSVMEVMMFILTKRSHGAVQPILLSLFLPLMLVLIVDQTEDCRARASSLLRKIFERADKERDKSLTAQMVKWLDTSEDQLWRTASLKAWPLYFEVRANSQQQATVVQTAAGGVVMDQVATDDAAVALVSGALESLISLCSLHPDVAFAKDTAKTWDCVTGYLESTNTNIAHGASRLIHAYLMHFAKSEESNQVSFAGPYGLRLTDEGVERIAHSSMQILSSPTSSSTSELLDLTIQDLTFLASLGAGSTLDTVLTHVSSALRLELPPTAPPYTKFAALKLLSTLLSRVAMSSFDAYAQALLVPLHHLTAPALSSSAPTSSHPDFATTNTAVGALAQEVMATIQERLGPERYISEMQTVQRTVRERREERRGKRALDAVSEPEKAEKERKRRMLAKKGARKRKGEAAAGMRRGW